MAADGLVTLQSGYAPKETMKRLETEVKAKGLTVFARGIGWDVERNVVADFGKSTKGEEGGNDGNPSGIPGEEGRNLVDCNSCRLPPKMSAKSNRLPPLPPVHG